MLLAADDGVGVGVGFRVGEIVCDDEIAGDGVGVGIFSGEATTGLDAGVTVGSGVGFAKGEGVGVATGSGVGVDIRVGPSVGSRVIVGVIVNCAT